ncbi:MAG: ABC transporter ATP-binding protein [Clostridiales bacterium]|jgi:simple sugar transport system ATP-binding protein|nr:ABC transporter ATP-binding protein [Clostridiales bacterium]
MEPLLEARNISKVYPNGMAANRSVNFSLQKGEIHALAGENGAGKSTLMKILFGMEKPSEGELRLNGAPFSPSSPQDAISKGLGMVHQHFMLVPSFTIAQNVILGAAPRKGLSVDWKKASQETADLSAKYNFSLDPNKRVEDLSVGMKQKVEIIKALYRGAKILILDEPTAVLTPQETAELFSQLFKLRESGITIVFISHKLKEVKAICNRITILRGGRNMGVFQVSDVSEQEISRLMVGRDVALKYDKDNIPPGDAILEINRLFLKNEDGKTKVSNVSFSVPGGRILGIAGVDGNGQNELARAVMGEIPIASGEIRICGKPATGKLQGVRQLETGYIPEDRMKQGTAGDASISDNLISIRLKSPEVCSRGILRKKKISALSESLVGLYRILCSSADQKVSMLSGGNMQKVVVARECSTSPKLLVADQPTRGVDVGSAELIHHKLLELRKNGTAILLVSADLNEVMELSDHLAIMFNGQISAYFEDPSQVSEEELGLYMLGLKKQEGIS